MAGIAFATRQDGLLPEDWTPRPRTVTEGDEPEEPVDEVIVEELPVIVETPQRQSATPSQRVLGPPPLAEVRSASDSDHGEISGEVRERLTGEPIADAMLTFRHEDELFETHSDSEGLFRFAAPREGAFVLALTEAQGYFPLTSTLDEGTTFFTSRAQRLGAVQVRLAAVTPLRVLVHGTDGAMVSARVRIVGERATLASNALYDAPDGDALVPAAEGTTLEATTGDPQTVGHARVRASSTLTGVLHVHTHSVAANDSALRGQVLSLLGSEPISGAQVDVESESAEGTTRVARLVTDEEGHFVYEGSAPGPFSLTARATGFAMESRTQPTRDTSAVLLLSEEASVEGRVVDAEGAPIPSFVVFAEAHVGTLERRLRGRSDTFDARGEFRLGGLSSGGYTISVAAEGYAPLTQEVHLSRGASARPQDFRLLRGVALEGFVRGNDGAPLAGVHVRTESAIAGTGLPISADVQSNSEGVFHIEGLSAGQIRLTFALPGHHPRAITAQSSDARVEVTLNEVAAGEEPRLEATEDAL